MLQDIFRTVQNFNLLTSSLQEAFQHLEDSSQWAQI